VSTQKGFGAQFKVPNCFDEKSSEIAVTLLISRRRERNLRTTNDSLLPLAEEGKKGRRGVSILLTQEPLNESYKAEKINSANPAVNRLTGEGLWLAVRDRLTAELSQPAFDTWIAPIAWDSSSASGISITVASNFNREQVLKRYGHCIKQHLLELAGSPIKLDVVVNESLSAALESSGPVIRQRTAQTALTPKPKSPWAAQQNPTNNPEIEMLLEKHGDMRQVFIKDPRFTVVMSPEKDGGWNIGLGALINAGKEYTLERVLWAVKEAKIYPGAASRRGIFYHILRKGLEER
jgi:hypothetical protein